MMTRFIEETPTTEYIEYTGIIDGNGGTSPFDAPQFEYIDGNDCPQPGVLGTTIYETRVIQGNPDPDWVWADFLFDGNIDLVENTMLYCYEADGNTVLQDGNGPNDVAKGLVLPTHRFTFDNCILLDDSSYVLFGHPIEFPNLSECHETFEDTVELAGMRKSGELTTNVVWPPVPYVEDTTYYLKNVGSGNILEVGSSLADGMDIVYPDLTPTSDYGIIKLVQGATKYLHNESSVVETFDGKTLDGETYNKPKLKGAVLFWGSWYWCEIQYNTIVSMTIIDDINDIYNREIHCVE